jgi:hypothetical protein
MCGGELVTREDDTEEALEVRLRQWHEQAEAVLEIFRRKEYVFVVDARPAPEIVQQQIRQSLGLPPYRPRPEDPPGANGSPASQASTAGRPSTASRPSTESQAPAGSQAARA